MAATGWGDHVGTQLTCSMFSGLVTTTATNPADVVKVVMFTSECCPNPKHGICLNVKNVGRGAFGTSNLYSVEVSVGYVVVHSGKTSLHAILHHTKMFLYVSWHFIM